MVDGTAVTGTLPGPVVFANTYGINDYEQAITFGNALSFVLSFLNTAPFVSSGTLGSSDFSLGLLSDAFGVLADHPDGDGVHRQPGGQRNRGHAGSGSLLASGLGSHGSRSDPQKETEVATNLSPAGN